MNDNGVRIEVKNDVRIRDKKNGVRTKMSDNDIRTELNNGVRTENKEKTTV